MNHAPRGLTNQQENHHINLSFLHGNQGFGSDLRENSDPDPNIIKLDPENSLFSYNIINTILIITNMIST